MSQLFTSLLNRATEKPNESSGEWKVFSPASQSEELGKCVYRYSDLDLAAGEAQIILSDLKRMGFLARMTAVHRAMEVVRKSKAELAELSSKELGRGTDDFETEWSCLERFFEGLAHENFSSIQGSEARGVTAVIGSYVWPVFYSLQFTLLNFLAGNPVILKPSEKATLVSLRLFEVLRAQLPEFAAIQVLVGDREVGRRLACHESISTVIFQGSFEVGMRVKQDTLSQPGKQVLLYLGAKNPAIVFKDAPEAVYETLLKDAFQGAGQSCQSASVVFVESAFLEEFADRFHDLSKKFKIGAPDSGAFMGPLIDGAMLDRYLKFIGISEREGAEIIMRGKPLPVAGKGHYVTPTLALIRTLSSDQMKKSVSLQTEILSPHLSMVGFENEESLSSVLHQMNHGRNSAVWTSDPVRANRCAEWLEYGGVAINQSLLHLDSWNSFQARKRSGNHALLGKGLLSQLVYLKNFYS